MMSQWTLFSVAVLFISNVVADILVQPGYGQPQAIVQPQSTLHPIVQPRSTYQQASENEDNQQNFDAGYHIELHPVYPGMSQLPADQTVSYSLLQPHQLSPYLSRAAQRRLNSGKFGDLGVAGLPLGMPTALSPQYVPLAVHSRLRRAIGDQPSAGLHHENPGKADVAPNSSLSKDVPRVVDLQSLNAEATKNLEEKRVEVRQSDPTNTGGLLLGLNPSNMYPVYHQYRAVETPLNSAINSHQQIISPQVSQVTSRTSIQERTPSEQAATPTQTTNTEPRVNLLRFQHTSSPQPALQQQPQSGMLQQSVEHERRNTPDPRPAARGLAVPQMVATEAEDMQSDPPMTVRASPAETIDGKELVGTKHKVKIHVHKHETYTIPRSTSGESYGCTCTSPGYVAYDGTSSPGYVVYDGSSSPGYVVYDGSSSNPAVAQPSSQPMVQVYQVPSVPSVQGASYSPNANYAVLPSSYSNYVSSFNYPSASSFNFCPQSLNSAPPLVYRLI